MHRIGGSKQAIDGRVSGAVSDACAKLAVCHCKAHFESVHTKVQQASISCSAHVNENYGGFKWCSEVERSGRHTSFIDCKASISADRDVRGKGIRKKSKCYKGQAAANYKTKTRWNSLVNYSYWQYRRRERKFSVLGCFQKILDISVGSYPIHIKNRSIYSANSCRISHRKKDVKIVHFPWRLQGVFGYQCSLQASRHIQWCWFFAW
jgi:hypothetical protein